MKDKLISLGDELVKFYKERADLVIDIDGHQHMLDLRMIALIPVEGWQGKNVDERNAHRDRVYADNEELQKVIYSLRASKDMLILLDAHIAGLEARRRALEWAVRVEAIMKGVNLG